MQPFTFEELQKKCRKSLTLKVEDPHVMEEVLKSMKINDFEVFPNGDVKIYDEVEIGAFVSDLHKKKVKILTIKSSDENVEDYYLNLVAKYEAEQKAKDDAGALIKSIDLNNYIGEEKEKLQQFIAELKQLISVRTSAEDIYAAIKSINEYISSAKTKEQHQAEENVKKSENAKEESK